MSAQNLSQAAAGGALYAPGVYFCPWCVGLFQILVNFQWGLWQPSQALTHAKGSAAESLLCQHSTWRPSWLLGPTTAPPTFVSAVIRLNLQRAFPAAISTFLQYSEHKTSLLFRTWRTWGFLWVTQQYVSLVLSFQSKMGFQSMLYQKLKIELVNP